MSCNIALVIAKVYPQMTNNSYFPKLAFPNEYIYKCVWIPLLLSPSTSLSWQYHEKITRTEFMCFLCKEEVVSK